MASPAVSARKPRSVESAADRMTSWSRSSRRNGSLYLYMLRHKSPSHPMWTSVRCERVMDARPCGACPERNQASLATMHEWSIAEVFPLHGRRSIEGRNAAPVFPRHRCDTGAGTRVTVRHEGHPLRECAAAMPSVRPSRQHAERPRFASESRDAACSAGVPMRTETGLNGRFRAGAHAGIDTTPGPEERRSPCPEGVDRGVSQLLSWTYDSTATHRGRT